MATRTPFQLGKQLPGLPSSPLDAKRRPPPRPVRPELQPRKGVAWARLPDKKTSPEPESLRAENQELRHMRLKLETLQHEKLQLEEKCRQLEKRIDDRDSVLWEVRQLVVDLEPKDGEEILLRYEMSNVI
jgi:hypothetical protein